jgi:hypothetical protein
MSEIGKEVPLRDWRPILLELSKELGNALQRHGDFRSAHEAYAVLLEEVDELWEECKKKKGVRSLDLMRKEWMQIAAVAIKAIGTTIDFIPFEPD